MMAMYGGTLGCLTLWFCHYFQEIFRGQLMRSRSVHNSESSTRQEARLIPMRWLVALLPMLMNIWVRRWWALCNGLRPCAMLGSRSHRYWPGGELGGRGGSMPSRSRSNRTSRTLCLCLWIVLFLVFVRFVGFLYFDDIFLWQLFIFISYFQFKLCW